jgi:hypothetical protein
MIRLLHACPGPDIGGPADRCCAGDNGITEDAGVVSDVGGPFHKGVLVHPGVAADHSLFAYLRLSGHASLVLDARLFADLASSRHPPVVEDLGFPTEHGVAGDAGIGSHLRLRRFRLLTHERSLRGSGTP